MIRAFVGTISHSAIALFGMVPCLAQKPSLTLEIQVPESEFTVGTEIRFDVVVKNSMTEDPRLEGFA